MKACLAGDEGAWVELWHRYGPLVKAVSRRVGCDQEEARDVLQRVALVALQGLSRLRDPEKLAGWLAGTARYQSLEMIRSRHSSESLSPVSAIHHPQPEESLQRAHDLAILVRALSKLDERCRRLIRRLDLTEPAHSYRDVAEEEGLAPSSIGPIRRRCLQRLRKFVDSLSQSRLSSHLGNEG